MLIIKEILFTYSFEVFWVDINASLALYNVNYL